MAGLQASSPKVGELARRLDNAISVSRSGTLKGIQLITLISEGLYQVNRANCI